MIRVSFQIGGWLSILLACWLAQLTVDKSSWQPVPHNDTGTIHSPIQRLKAQPRPQIKPFHLVLGSASQRLKVYDPHGILLFTCRASTRAINSGFYHYGSCPPGTYVLGKTVITNSAAFGRFAIPVLPLDSNSPLHWYHRSGIYAHGGGSGLSHPLADYQPLIPTHGCLRFHNLDLAELVRINHRARTRGTHLLLTIQ